MKRDGILITGITSKIGVNIVKRLLEKTDFHLWLLVRKSPEFPNPDIRVRDWLKANIYSFDEKLIELRMTIFEGNLSDRQLGIPDKYFYMMCDSKILEIIHLAALTDREMFTKDNLFNINFEGTNRLLNLASRLNVQCFNYVGQLYSCGKLEYIGKKDYLDYMEKENDFNNLNEFVQQLNSHNVLTRCPDLKMAYRIFNAAYMVDLDNLLNMDGRWYNAFLKIFYEIKKTSEEVYGKNYFKKRKIRFYCEDVELYMTTTDFVADIMLSAIEEESASHNKIFNLFNASKSVQPLIQKVTEELLGVQTEFVPNFASMNFIEQQVCLKSTTFFEYIQQKKKIEVDQEVIDLCKKYSIRGNNLENETLIGIAKEWLKIYESNRKDTNLNFLSKILIKLKGLEIS